MSGSEFFQRVPVPNEIYQVDEVYEEEKQDTSNDEFFTSMYTPPVGVNPPCSAEPIVAPDMTRGIGVLEKSMQTILKEKYPEFNIPEPNADGYIQCMFCGNFIKAKNSYVFHLRTNQRCLKIRRREGVPIFAAEPPIVCPYCDRTVSTKASLKRHVFKCKGKKIKMIKIED
jgi:uncharacterized C2H2 Zn-finger protein